MSLENKLNKVCHILNWQGQVLPEDLKSFKVVGVSEGITKLGHIQQKGQTKSLPY